MKGKNRKLIWSFRIWAVYDVLFSKKFELKKYDKNNRVYVTTKFDYEEIKNAKL